MMHISENVINHPVIVLIGPTAIGKTELSLTLSEEFDCEIVSLDSMQVYKYMDIGTAKVTLEERTKIRHHMIDVVNPDEGYDAHRYVVDAGKAMSNIIKRGKIPLITGGTGLYLKALTQGLFEEVGEFPEIRKQLRQRLHREGSSKLHKELDLCDHVSASKIHKNDSHRLLRALEIYLGTGLPWSQHIHNQKKHNIIPQALQIGLFSSREQLYNRINRRCDIMLESGLEKEVRGLLERGYQRDLKSMKSIGYRHMIGHLLDGWSLERTKELLARDTRHYAKRQITWFNGYNFAWFKPTRTKEIQDCIEKFLSSQRDPDAKQ